jgi:hypothetical protein
MREIESSFFADDRLPRVHKYLGLGTKLPLRLLYNLRVSN